MSHRDIKPANILLLALLVALASCGRGPYCPSRAVGYGTGTTPASCQVSK